MNILAIESSCDETACAIIKDGTEILSNVVASSTAMHEKWGGIVPEVAAREQLSSIIPVLTEALLPLCHPELIDGSYKNNKIQDSGSEAGMTETKSLIQNNIDAITVTVGPGLIGSLLIGIETAKTLAFVTGKPIIPVNHVLAHMYANFLKVNFARRPLSKLNTTMQQFNIETIVFPAISLVVSGGHTELFLMNSVKDLKWLGGTIDDAAGEAFDKTARLLGFGSRGGLAIQESAQLYCHSCESRNLEYKIPDQVRNDRNKAVKLPRPLLHDNTLNFSFSGLKTAILREVNKLKENNQLDDMMVQQLAFEVQEAITDVLVAKTIKAVEQYNAKSILISGGVASNLHLREKFISNLSQSSPQISFFAPIPSLCTDNAAYIGSYAYFRGKPVDWHDVTAVPDLSVEV